MNPKYTPLLLALLLGAGAPTGGVFTATAVAADAPEHDDNHYYGIGIGRTYEDACESARGNLLNNIMVTIEVSSSSFVQQKKENGGVDNKEEFSHLVKSYSSATTLHKSFTPRCQTVSNPLVLYKSGIYGEDEGVRHGLATRGETFAE